MSDAAGFVKWIRTQSPVLCMKVRVYFTMSQGALCTMSVHSYRLATKRAPPRYHTREPGSSSSLSHNLSAMPRTVARTPRSLAYTTQT